MIPILYQTITEGTVPSDYGLGALSDCISCTITEERNGAYELTMIYSADGIHAEDIEPNRFIKAKPNYTDGPQLFRIYKVGKTINGQFTVSAQHVSYDLSGKLILDGSAGSCVAACALLDNKAGNFTISTDKSTVASFSVSEPSSVRSWFGGKQGSLLDVYGGEWKYNNYTAELLNARGMDRGVTIRYGKNLTQLSQELDMSNLVTGIVPYFIDTNGNKTVGTMVPTGLVLDVPREVAIDFSQDVNPESSTPIATQLANLATRYKNNNKLTSFMDSITLDFVQLESLTERVDLCDTVHIYFEALGISASAKCISTTWDVLADRYTSTTFGDSKTNIADTIAKATGTLEKTPTTTEMQKAVTRATELITGNLGGYVINGYDSNGDGYPDENLIMDTTDINTAVKVIRSNLGGIGLSTTGYAGPFKTAITAEGIVADAITTGTLNADLIKAGTISDTGGNSTINMTTGEARLNNLKAKLSFQLLGTSSNVKASLNHMGTDGAQFLLYDNSNHALVDLWAHNGDGSIQLNNSSGYQRVSLAGDLLRLQTSTGMAYVDLGLGANGASLSLRNTSGGERITERIANGGGGYIGLYNAGGDNQTIYANGTSGNITCVSLTQTSSRKVKENIKPIADSEKILELDAVSFDFKDKAKGTDKRGFIAEDVAKVLPNLVTPETEETPASLDYVGMIPYLQDIIKKQEARIKALEDKLNGIN